MNGPGSLKVSGRVADPERMRLLTITMLLAALSAAGCAGNTGSADCDGHNGNAAVAACHPNDQAVQDACPENSNGEDYAAPTDVCLAAVRGSDAAVSPEPPVDENDPCLQEASRAVDRANADGTGDETRYMSQECLDRGF